MTLVVHTTHRRFPSFLLPSQLAKLQRQAMNSLFPTLLSKVVKFLWHKHTKVFQL